MALSLVASHLISPDLESWNGGQRTPVLVTYSFAAFADGFTGYAFTGPVQGFSAAQQAAARQALEAWGSVSGLAFLEVRDQAGGRGIDIRFGMAALGEEVAGYGGPPPQGDVLLNATLYAAEALAPGSFGYYALLHEIGHTLGLQHPFPALNPGQANTTHTVMAYPLLGLPDPTGLGPADVEAIRFLYGTQAEEEALGIRWSWDAARQGILHQADDAGRRITGTALRDIIQGGGGDDVLHGGAGNDLLAGGGGHNLVEGGTGRDRLETALFRHEAVLEGLVLAPEADPWPSLSGLLRGGAEETRFSGIETIAFADGRLVFDAADPVAQVARLYQAALGRAPDAVGREFWTTQLAQGTALEALADAFLGSAEFQARFGALDDAGFVLHTATQALGTPPDAAALAGWQAVLAGGMGRAALLAGLSESAESQAQSAPLLAAGLWDADDTTMQAARLIRAVLDRAPEAGELHLWTSTLAAGMSLAEAGADLAAGPAFQARFGTQDDAGFIHAAYAEALGRTPDAAGLAFWLDGLAQGLGRGAVLAGFSESAEFIQRHAGLLEGGIAFA